MEIKSTERYTFYREIWSLKGFQTFSAEQLNHGKGWKHKAV